MLQPRSPLLLDFPFSSLTAIKLQTSPVECGWPMNSLDPKPPAPFYPLGQRVHIKVTGKFLNHRVIRRPLPRDRFPGVGVQLRHCGAGQFPWENEGERDRLRFVFTCVNTATFQVCLPEVTPWLLGLWMLGKSSFTLFQKPVYGQSHPLGNDCTRMATLLVFGRVCHSRIHPTSTGFTHTHAVRWPSLGPLRNSRTHFSIKKLPQKGRVTDLV